MIKSRPVKQTLTTFVGYALLCPALPSLPSVPCPPAHSATSFALSHIPSHFVLDQHILLAGRNGKSVCEQTFESEVIPSRNAKQGLFRNNAAPEAKVFEKIAVVTVVVAREDDSSQLLSPLSHYARISAGVIIA